MEPLIQNLREAVQFLDKCKADPEARYTGSLNDAHQWVEEAARALVNHQEKETNHAL